MGLGFVLALLAFVCAAIGIVMRDVRLVGLSAALLALISLVGGGALLE